LILGEVGHVACIELINA